MKVRPQPFGDFHGWFQDCVFSLGPDREIFVGEGVVPEMQYRGSGIRADPAVQNYREEASNRFWSHRLACEAMIVYDTVLHGADLGELVRHEQKASVHGLENGWSLLTNDYSYGTRLLERAYLVWKGAIYIPFADPM